MPDYTIKMTYEKAEEARRLFRDGMEIQDLCNQFNLSPSAMRDIVRGKAWKSKPQNSPKPSKKSKNNHQSAKNKWDDVYKLWRDGKTSAEIAQTLGISDSYISLIQWTIKCARKDPEWAEAQKDKKYSKMAAWADYTVKQEVTKEDWKSVAIELARRHKSSSIGEWVNLTPPEFREDRRSGYYPGCDLQMCSICRGACRFITETIPYKYCPNCGAEMLVEDVW